MVGLTAADYAVLGVHIALSAAVGLLVGRKQHSGESYFLAGRSANGVAIAVSLLSGVASGISYLGIPGYAYSDGMGFVFSVLSYPISLGFAAFAIIPFFHSLGMCTAYAYLEARFSRAVRTAAALVFVLRVVVYLSVVLYAPALALAALTGLPIWLTIVVIGSIATPYTIKGGMAAVLWTDFLQSLMMIVCAVLMAAVANSRIGGAAGVMREMKRGERTVTAEFFEPNPTRSERPAETFWSMVVGYSVISLAQLSTDQIVVQRYMTAKSAQECRRSVLLNGVLQLVFSSMLNYLGWSLYAYYHERTARTGAPDPLAAGDIASSDQLSAYFALTELPKGMAGLLIAAVLGSTMSVFSGGVNAAATSCYVDLMEGRLGLRHSAAQTVRVSREVSFLLALVIIALAFAASSIHGLVKMGVIATCLCSPLLGVFLLGMLSRRCNSQGAVVGLGMGLAAVLLMAASNIGSSLMDKGAAVCRMGHALGASRVSVFWFGAVGALTTVLTGYVAALWWPAPDPRLLRGLTMHSKGEALAPAIRLRFAAVDSDSDAAESSAHREQRRLLN
eukprot:m.273534 g.273534  ORF g.273534 m.273534 type:complete len:561 (-) comp11090_c1_seq20:409-2091(-)